MEHHHVVHLQLIFSICWHLDSQHDLEEQRRVWLFFHPASSEFPLCSKWAGSLSKPGALPSCKDAAAARSKSRAPVSWSSMTLTAWSNRKRDVEGKWIHHSTGCLCLCRFVSLHVFHWSSYVWSEIQTSSPPEEFVRKEALIRMPSIDFLQVQSGALSASNQWLDTTLHFLVANKAVRLCSCMRVCPLAAGSLFLHFVWRITSAFLHVTQTRHTPCLNHLHMTANAEMIIYHNNQIIYWSDECGCQSVLKKTEPQASLGGKHFHLIHVWLCQEFDFD